MHAGLRARPGTDCATRTRIVYRAERPLTEDDGGWLPEATRTLSPFSSFVAGAKDHLRLTLGSELEASFAVGGDELVVAYGKLGTKVPWASCASSRRASPHGSDPSTTTAHPASRASDAGEPVSRVPCAPCPRPRSP